MVEWKHIKGSAYGPYESYNTIYKEYSITVISHGRASGYCLRWQRNGDLQAQICFDAKDFDEAKIYALNYVRDQIAARASYWRDMKIGFVNWLEKEQ